jgi:hypothetical protein
MGERLIDVCNEIHGMNDAMVLRADGYSPSQSVLVSADGLWIRLNKTEGSAFPAGLTPVQARYLATKLRRCAALVERRRSAVHAELRQIKAGA